MTPPSASLAEPVAPRLSTIRRVTGKAPRTPKSWIATGPWLIALKTLSCVPSPKSQKYPVGFAMVPSESALAEPSKLNAKAEQFKPVIGAHDVSPDGR